MFRSSMKWKMENQFQLQINSFQFTDAFSPRQSLLNLFHDPTKASVEGVGSEINKVSDHVPTPVSACYLSMVIADANLN